MNTNREVFILLTLKYFPMKVALNSSKLITFFFRGKAFISIEVTGGVKSNSVEGAISSYISIIGIKSGLFRLFFRSKQAANNIVS